jgi:hypothetical protein
MAVKGLLPVDLYGKMSVSGDFSRGGKKFNYWTVCPDISLYLHQICLHSFEVLTAVLLKIDVVWDVMLCHWVSVPWHFEGLWYLHLQG